jgi:hypothetical protein
LLAPRAKKNPTNLALVGVMILLLRFLDIHYNVAPMLGPLEGKTGVLITDALASKVGSLLFFGGLWCFLFANFVTRAPLLVRNQPQLKEAVDHA